MKPLRAKKGNARKLQFERQLRAQLTPIVKSESTTPSLARNLSIPKWLRPDERAGVGVEFLKTNLPCIMTRIRSL